VLCTIDPSAPAAERLTVLAENFSEIEQLRVVNENTIVFIAPVP
jgi:hypothetical protein